MKSTLRNIAGIATLIGVLGTPAFANTPTYPITTRADPGVSVSTETAAKARNLAEHVITGDDLPSTISYNGNKTAGATDYQGVEVVMVIGDQRYTIWVANENEGSARPRDDLISIWMRPNGTYNQSELTTFSDNGLDGNCDFGIASSADSPPGKV